MISHLQKSFLDQLNSECDLNAAAAKVLLFGWAPALTVRGRFA